MSRQVRILAAVVTLVIAGVGVGLLALFRIQQTKDFTQPHRVHTPEGTNYVVQLVETAVGKTDTDCVLIVYMKLENPNPFEVALDRDSFFLIDRYRVRYRPSTTGTQSELIKLPANGVLEKEMLSFTVPEDTFAGRIALSIGQDHRVMIKDQTPFDVRLGNDEFRSFSRRSW
jgi:hypothetical protein